jgi:Immunity protein 8
MRAEIRRLHIDPATFTPDDPERFAFLIQMIAGPAGEKGEESFDFEVCTPGWLHDRARREGPVNGRHHLVTRLAVAYTVRLSCASSSGRP